MLLKNAHVIVFVAPHAIHILCQEHSRTTLVRRNAQPCLILKFLKFKNGFAKIDFEMLVIFTKILPHAQQRWFWDNRR